MVKHIRWADQELEQLNPLLARQLAVGENVMVARILLKKGCVVPLHSHDNEQVSCMLEGALRFSMDQKDFIVRAGEVIAIPPNIPHLAEALEDCVALDIFYPPRMDWINKTDDYLRK
ncbi:MAG: cupin domain-containing protein [Terriglobia bacterium]